MNVSKGFVARNKVNAGQASPFGRPDQLLGGWQHITGIVIVIVIGVEFFLFEMRFLQHINGIVIVIDFLLFLKKNWQHITGIVIVIQFIVIQCVIKLILILY